MENARKSKETVEDLFFKFMDAQDCPEITSTFRQLVKLLGIKSENAREFYSLLKGKLQSWRCKSLWELLDSRANQNEYGKGKICEDTHVLVIGAGPIGLRTAIEAALLGAHVVIVEKRESFVRNNVLHLWPFLLTDFRSLGAKKFYGKFCCSSIDHISIRRLQAVLLKTALIFGAKLYTGVTFDHVIEPNSLEDGWKCKVSPASHPVSQYEFDVLIGADGKKNVIPGFQQIEMRGTLAIGITANFVNHGTEEEAKVEEISGIAYQFNPQFFDQLSEQKGIKLENIVYYKDETHYFVMTAGKASLLKRGALKQDFGPPAKLLAPSNIDHSKLLEYVTDVVKYATKGTLISLELKIVGNNQPDIAAFDFTSIKKAEHAARIIERKGSKLLVGLVGDSLLEPFWPTGSGCARGVLSALDAAWTIRSFAQDKPPLQILGERENIYRLLSGTSAENLHKDPAKYTINPSTRYLHITHKRIREVYHLFDTDDPVNADFSIGSPQIAVSNKASRRKRISTGAKFTSTKGRKRGRASSHLAADANRLRSTSGSSMENLAAHNPLSSTRSVPLDGRMRARTSVGSDDEVFQIKTTRRVRINPVAIPLTRRSRSSTIGSSGDELKDKRRKTARKRSTSKDNPENSKENTRRKKGFFGFGKSKPKRKTAEDSDHSDKDNKLFKVKRGEQHEQTENKFGNGITLKSVQKREEGKANFVREDSWKRRPAGSFSREHYTRRSTRDIIKEMEARSKGEAAVASENTTDERVAKKASDTADIPEKQRNGEANKEGEKNRKMKTENKEMEEKMKVKKEDEKKKHKEDERKRKEEERKKRKMKKESTKKKREEKKMRKKERKRTRR
ncbi:hypothetical protein OS493_024716 [Desmophyllum pertusum]|uniref:FAD-binding domain-containing protein n=1 Tax=Desmophyllum pertusum TaxID=174260 RepID=A0A9W9ZDA7_9CNID|nr:hypothetical protein OS493_024716 [Desmophyllum pertusum]